MQMTVSPNLGAIDEEWKLFAAHMRLPAPVFHVISRPVPHVEMDVSVLVYSSCLIDDLKIEDISTGHGHRSWADALKSSEANGQMARVTIHKSKLI